jgi:hypothetical protein
VPSRGRGDRGHPEASFIRKLSCSGGIHAQGLDTSQHHPLGGGDFNMRMQETQISDHSTPSFAPPMDPSVRAWHSQDTLSWTVLSVDTPILGKVTRQVR